MKILAVLIGLTLSFNVFADNEKNDKTVNESPATQTSLQGQIIDKTTGEALAGVTVVLDNGTETYTDFDGNFVFPNVGPGKYQLKTSLISYENITFNNITLDASDSKSMTIQLKSL